MATLRKLTTMKDTEIQHWLRNVEKVGVPILVRALLGADQEVRDRVFRNLSAPAGQALEKELEEARQLGLSAAEIDYHTRRLEQLL